MTRLVTAVTVALLGGAAWVAGQGIGLPPFGTPRPGPPVKASLLADVQAVQPGGSVTLAVRLKIDPQWHVYWRNPGQTGLPTRIELTVPKGFKAGPVQVPPPVELSSGGILSYALHDPAVYLIDVQAPPDAPIGQEVTFRAKVKWLACKVQCIPGQAELSLSLPVEPADRPARPANVELFRAARARLPVRADPDAALSLTVRAEPPTVRPGQSFNLAVQVELADGYWIPAHASGADSLAPTELFVDPPAGITTLQVVYPTGRARRLRYVARLRAKRDLQPGTVTIRGLLRYQLRPADGSARPERYLQWELPLEVVTEAKTVEGLDRRGRGPIAAVQGRPARPTRPTSGPAEAGPTAVGSGAIGGLTLRRLMLNVLLGLIGGLILNVMPCVLPVISIKVLSLVRQGSEQPGRILRMGLVFAAGIVATFEALAVLVIVAKWQGRQMGWGFQFQYPQFVIGISVIILVFALSLLGVYQINLPGRSASRLSQLEQREGYWGSFAKGALATVLATPCTAPFLGAAVGFAFTQPASVILLIFTSVAVGMACPYVLLAARPAWMKYIPRPGAWMVSFKQLMGFLLLATLIWLLSIVGAQLGAAGVVWTAAFLLGIALACWLIGRTGLETPPLRRAAAWIAAAGIAATSWWISFRSQFDISEALARPPQMQLAGHDPASLDWSEGIPWGHFSPGRVAELVGAGYTVFVDFSADWCLTCKANETLVLQRRSVVEAMQRLGVVPLKADFTRPDPVIAEQLQRFGRMGVPLYVIYPAFELDRPIVLPELISRSMVLEGLEQAGASRPGDRAGRAAAGPGSADS